MITVLCANAGLDKTYEVPGYTLGGFHHPKRVRTAPGGKGINVARVLRALDQEVTLTGFVGGAPAPLITRYLRREGIAASFVEIAEESRLCINVVDTQARTQTRLDEVGPLVSPTEIAQLKLRWEQLLAKSSIAIISGSAPRGVPFDLYGELILAARKRKVITILDAHDEMLRDGIQAGPTIVKPNLAELSVLFDKELSVPDGAAAAARELLQLGVQLVICSLGANGAIVVTRDHGEWRARPPQVDAVSPVGCGDAMVAGFAAASASRLGLEERIRWSVAAGASCAETFGAGFADGARITELAPQVRVQELSDTSELFGEAEAEAGTEQS